MVLVTHGTEKQAIFPQDAEILENQMVQLTAFS